MSAVSLIHRYNRLNGNSIGLSKLKEFRAAVERHLDSVGHGPYVPDLKGILGRVNKLIKQMTDQGYEAVGRVELVPIDVKKHTGKILRVASGFDENDQKPENLVAEEISLSTIHTDTKRFQNRTDAFSEASANSVAQNYDANKFDPIVVWMDPEKKKLFVLSGHSRYEGMKRRGAKSIPVRYFKGTEEEAIKFAKVEANRAANQESLIEDLAAYKLMRDGDKEKGISKATKSELARIFKGKVQKLEAYSHLNPNGLFVQSLSQSNTSNFPYLERNSQWIGILRNDYSVISNQGEDNLFHFFYSDKAGRNIKLTRDDFFNLAKKRINQLSKGETVLFPECSSDGCKASVDKEADPQKGDAYKRLREINETLDTIREKLTSKNANVRVTTEDEKKYLRATAEKLEGEREKILRDLDLIDKSQASLFGPSDYEVRKAYFRGNKKFGRITQLIDKSTGKVLLETMGVSSKSQMVKQYESQLEGIALTNPPRNKQLRAMFARLANGGENYKKDKPAKNEVEKEPVKKPSAKQLKREAFVPKARGKKEIKKDYNEYLNDINKETARRAYYGTSFSPERRGDGFRDEYAANLVEFREEIKPRADKLGRSDEFEQDFAHYRQKMKALATAYLHSHSNVMSSMITGPANFPVARNRKRGDWADNKLKEYFNYDKYMREKLRLKYTRDELKPVKTGQDNALEILQKKLEARERSHQIMLEANKVIRSKKTYAEKIEDLVKVGVSEKTAREMLTPDRGGKTGVPTFYLANNNAEIKRLKGRIAQVEKLNLKREGENKTTEYSNGSVVENFTEDRLQIIFPGKPDEKVRTKLKQSGFKWSPRHGAWQRQLTNNARSTLKYIMADIGLSGPQIDAFEVKKVAPTKGPLNRLQRAALEDAIKAGRTPKVNLKAKLNAKKKAAPLFDEPVNDPRQASLFGLVDASALCGITFKTYELDGEWKEEFQKLNSDTQGMFWGLPGSGKTVKQLRFAQYMAEKLGLKTLYVANEEFGRSSLAEKIKTFNIGHANLKFAKHVDEKIIDQFDVIFFDSINSLGMSLDDYKALRDRHPGKMYWLIVQSTKDGDFRGGQEWEHEVDVAVEVVNRKLIFHKNRFDKDTARKKEEIEMQAAIDEQKKKRKIRDAVKTEVVKTAA